MQEDRFIITYIMVHDFMTNYPQAHHVVMAMLIWLYTRNNVEKSVLPLIVSLLLLSSSKQSLLELVGTLFHISSLGILGLSVLLTLLVCLIATHLYVSLCIQDNSWGNPKVY